MKRSVGALVTALLLAAVVVVPVSAAPPKMTASACINANNIMLVTVKWSKEPITAGVGLTITTAFSGGAGSPFSTTNSYPAPIPSAGSEQFGFVLSQGSAWSDWTMIDNSASGAFVDTAPTINEPGSGWRSCK